LKAITSTQRPVFQNTQTFGELNVLFLISFLTSRKRLQTTDYLIRA